MIRLWEQVVWVLVSLAGAVIVMLFVVLTLPEKIKAVGGQVGIAVNVLPWFWLPFTGQPRPSGTVGLILSVVGVCFFVFGMLLLGEGYLAIRSQIGWAHAESHSIVKEGPYRFLRHPIYVGLATAALGWALLWGGVYAVLLTPFFYLILGAGAWSEEKQLLRRFGEVYAGYRQETPAFFPAFLAIPLVILAFSVGLCILLGWIPLA